MLALASSLSLKSELRLSIGNSNKRMDDDMGYIDQRPKRLLMIAYPVLGHIKPLLELARRLSTMSHQITFAVTENLIDEMRHRNVISPLEEQRFRLISLKDGTQPATTKGTSVVVNIAKMERAHRDLIESVIGDSDNSFAGKLDAVIVDVCCADAVVTLCQDYLIPVHVFSASSGTSALKLLVRKAIGHSTSRVCDENMHPGPQTDKIRISSANTENVLSNVDSVLVNSYEALEPRFRHEFMETFPVVENIPVRFVGPLLQSRTHTPRQQTKPHFCPVTTWLNKQADRSIIYVSFGSVAVCSAEQVKDFTECLLSLQRPFIWSIRARHDCHLLDTLQKAGAELLNYSTTLPYLILDSAPQKLILEHKATRLFVSRCGWNSTLEGITNGVPIVAWPITDAQKANADVVVQAGCGVALPDTGDLKNPRLISQAMIAMMIEGVAQWDKPITDNRLFLTAQSLRRNSEDAGGVVGQALLRLGELLSG